MGRKAKIPYAVPPKFRLTRHFLQNITVLTRQPLLNFSKLQLLSELPPTTFPMPLSAHDDISLMGALQGTFLNHRF